MARIDSEIFGKFDVLFQKVLIKKSNFYFFYRIRCIVITVNIFIATDDSIILAGRHFSSAIS